jgi:uncharacterized membrane protein YidH (DUF202 family)
MEMAFNLPKELNQSDLGRNTERILMKLAGIILVIIGVLILVYQGFTYTQTKKDLQIGSLQVTHQEEHNVWIPPVVGGACIVGGIAALALGAGTKF